MYKPAPPRYKKTKIVRSRNGCESCRRRRQKCDEKRPRCGTCERLDKRCEPSSGAALKFREVSFGHHGCRDDLLPAVSQIARTQASEDNAISIESTSPRSSSSESPSTQAVGSLTTFSDGSYPSPMSRWADVQLLDHGTLNIGDLTPSSLHQEQERTTIYPPARRRSLMIDSHARNVLHQQQVHDCANMDLTRALRFQGCLDQEMLYFNIWDTQCLEALHPVFRRYSILDRPCHAMLYATMALSASYIGRRLPQKKPWSLSDIPGLSYRPGTSHRDSSQHYYQRALRLVSSQIGNPPSLDVSSVLAALILFCNIESSMGNFSAFELHSKGIATFVQRSAELRYRAIADTHLLSAWLQARLLNWWRRVHFSPPALQNHRLPITVQPDLQNALHDPENRRVAVMLNLCESLSLLSRVIIRTWTAAQAAQTSTTIDGAAQTTQGNGAQVSDCFSELEAYRLELVAAGRTLDQWHARLPISDMPIESFPASRSESVKDNVALPPLPLLFSSHQAAMNYAYYASARAIQAQATLTITTTTTPATPTTTNDDDVDVNGYFMSNFWISLVIRIAAGIDWEKCVHYNVYTIGITALLFTCALRTQDLGVSLWIEDCLEERQREGLEEGSFPVLQLLRILRIINTERKNGIDVVAVFQTEDDGGGLGKFDSYHSQVITSVLLYWRCKITGQCLSKIVSV